MRPTVFAPQPLPQECHVRFLTGAHQRRAVEIDSTSPDPLDLVSLRALQCLPEVWAWALERRTSRADELLGWMLLDGQPYHVELMHLAVAKEWRRSGCGIMLMEHAKARVRGRRNRLSTLVPEDNVAGQCFLRAQGFACAGIVRAAYAPGRDGYRFVWVP